MTVGCGCAALGTKVKAYSAARFSAGRARNFIPKQSESHTVSGQLRMDPAGLSKNPSQRDGQNPLSERSEKGEIPPMFTSAIALAAILMAAQPPAVMVRDGDHHANSDP